MTRDEIEMAEMMGMTAQQYAQNKFALEREGVTLLCDPLSLQYLTGAQIDYAENLSGSQFVISNPNAKTTCGCGSSFST